MASVGRKIAAPLLAVLLLLLTAVALLHFVAPGLALFIGVWCLLSVPVGIAVGHCALSEDD